MGAALSSSASSASASSATLSAPLSAQYKFPAVVSRRFCTPRSVALELSDGFSRAAGGFSVSEARSARELLRLAPASALPGDLLAGAAALDGDRWVLDGYGVAIARLRPGERCAVRKARRTKHSLSYEISIGTNHPRRLTAVQVTVSTANSAPTDRRRLVADSGRRSGSHREPTLTVEFEDPQTGEVSQVGCAGDWERRRAAVLFLDRGAAAPRQAIAKAFRPDLDGLLGLTASSAFRPGSAFRVEVAPGVDASLVLLLCAALDDAVMRVTAVGGEADAAVGDDAGRDVQRGAKARTKGPEGDPGLLRRIHARLRP